MEAHTGRQRTSTPAGPGRAWVLGVFLTTLVVYVMASFRVLTYAEPPSGDQPHYLQTVISIVDDHDIDEYNNYTTSASYNQFYPVPYPPDFKGAHHPYPLTPGIHASPMPNRPPDEWYSIHGLGVPLLITPGWVIGKALTPLLRDLTASGGGGWPGTVFQLNLLGALLAVQVFLLAWETTARRSIALAVWAALAFSNPQMSFSLLIFPEIPGALLTIYPFRRLRLGWNANRSWQLLLIGLCIGYLPWLHPRLLPITAALLLFGLHQWWWAPGSSATLAVRFAHHGRQLGLLIGPVVLSAVLLAGYYQFLHESPLPRTQGDQGFFVPSVDNRGQLVFTDWYAVPVAALGLFLDQQWGLLIYAPVFLLAAVGAVALWRVPSERTTLAWLSAIILPYFLLVADFRLWWGTWNPPARYLAPVTPLLALPLAESLFVLRHSMLFRILYGLLASAGVLLMLGLLAGLGDRDTGQTFFNLPTGQARLLLWLDRHFQVNLVPFIPAFVPWFRNTQAALPWGQIIVWVSALAAFMAGCLVLLANPGSKASARPPTSAFQWFAAVKPRSGATSKFHAAEQALCRGWASTTKRAPWLWPYGGLALLLAAVMWRAWTSHDVLVLGGDAVLIHYPYFVLWRDALAAGEFPFWNPYTFSGIPAFATLQAGYGYPPHWALTWLPPIPAMNWTIGLHVVLAGLGAAWCAGRLGASKEGQFLSGVAYALGSAMISRMWAGHLSFLEANAWLPWATGLAIQVRQRGAVVYLALVVGLMTLAGQPEVVIFSLWWLPLWAGAAALRAGSWAVVRALLRVAVGCGFGLALSAFQLLPTMALLSVSNRQAGMSWDFLTGASLPPWYLLELLAPLVFGDPRQVYWPGPPYEWHERLLYVGLVPLVAAAWAPGRWRWICWGLAGLAVALAFGRHVPWYAWAHAILPGYESLRIPSKHLTLAALALALAAGLGIRRLHGFQVTLVILALAALIGMANLTFVQWFPLVAGLLGGAEKLVGPGAHETASAIAAPVLWRASLVLLVVALAALLPRLWAVRTLVVLATVELILVLHPFRVQQDDMRGVTAPAEVLRGYDRAAVLGGGGALFGNFGPVLRVEQPAGYVSLFSSGYAALVTGDANPGVAFEFEREAEPILHLLGYGVIVDPERSRVSSVQPHPPRAWVARCTWPGGALEVREPGFPRQSCVTHASATTREQPVAPGPARIVARAAGWLVVEAEGPGWLVTTEPWYPGWSAWLGDEPAPVEVVDGALVGVALRSGTQTMTLRYRPAGFDLGLLISLVSGLSLVAGWWVLRKRQGSRPKYVWP